MKVIVNKLKRLYPRLFNLVSSLKFPVPSCAKKLIRGSAWAQTLNFELETRN